MWRSSGGGHRGAGRGARAPPIRRRSRLPRRRRASQAGPRRSLRTVDPLLREVAYETLPGNSGASCTVGLRLRPAVPKSVPVTWTVSPTISQTTRRLAAEAADALADAGEASSGPRSLDALRLLERAVARGLSPPVGPPRAGQTTGDVRPTGGRARETLALIEDDPDDPVRGDRARSRHSEHPHVHGSRAAVPGSQKPPSDGARSGTWRRRHGRTANAGVAYFYLSRMEEAGAALERGLALFEKLGDESGVVATSSFLCLARPTDRRVPGWLRRRLWSSPRRSVTVRGR